MDLDNLYVIREIKDIPRALRSVKKHIRDIEDIARTIGEDEIDELIYAGCGSSYYAAIRSSHILTHSPLKLSALPVSELLWMLQRGHGSKPSRRVITVLSRSGETAEIRALVSKVKSSENSIVIGFTCNPRGYLANNSDYSIAIEDCMEESVYMTKSFVTLSSLGTIFSIKLMDNFGFRKPVDKLENELEVLVETSKILVSDIEMPRQLSNMLAHKHPLVVLGAEELYPIALEAALKFIEVSYTTTIALHALEFRHGYTGLFENPNISLIVLSNTDLPSYQYVERLYTELKSMGINAIHISNSKNADYVIEMSNGSILGTLAYIIPLYFAAVYRALSLGYNPNEPRHIVKVVSHF